MQLVEGLVSPRVELGVSRTRGPVFAFSGRYKLAGATAPPSTVEDYTLRRNRKGRAYLRMLVTQRNSAMASLRFFLNNQGPLCIPDTAGVHGRAFACAWADLG